MMKILVGIDQAEQANKAIEAAQLYCQGRERQCTITLIHIFTHPLVANDQEMELDTHAKEQVQAIESTLQVTKKRIEQAGVACDMIVGIGRDVASEICYHATCYGFDVIVMGSRGLGVFAEFIVGSVSHKVLHYATVPVMIARQNAKQIWMESSLQLVPEIWETPDWMKR